MANDLSYCDNEIILSASSITESFESHEDIPTTNKQNGSPYVSPLPSLVIDLLNSFRMSLGKIVDQTKFYQKQFPNNGLEECFFRIRSEIEKIDMVLNNFLEYDRIVTTIRKTNTVHNLIEKVLKKHQTELEKKEILVFRRFENNLPEVIVRDEELAYILDYVLQYILALMPFDGGSGGICFSTRSLGLLEKEGKGQTLPKEATRCVEILVIFTGQRSSIEKSNIVLGMQQDQTNKDLWNLILRLVKDMINKNRGVMKFGVGEEKEKSHISLIFPVEKEGSDLL